MTVPVPNEINHDIAGGLLLVVAAVCALLGGFLIRSECVESGRCWPSFPISQGWRLAFFFLSDSVLYLYLAYRVIPSANDLTLLQTVLLCHPGFWAWYLFDGWAREQRGSDGR